MPLLFAALLSVPVIVIEQSHSNHTWRTVSETANWVIWLAFLAEFVVLLYLAPARSQWLREHPLDIVIVLFTPPFMLSTFQTVRVLRILRVLRVVRLATLTRQVFSLEGLRYAALMTMLTALAGGAAFSSIEGRSLNKGMYWAMATMTTLGSKYEPTTDLGRILAVVLVVMGAGFLAVLTGAIAQRFTLHVSEAAANEHNQSLRAELKDVAHRLQRIEESLSDHRPPDSPRSIWSEDVIQSGQAHAGPEGATAVSLEPGEA